MKRIIAYFLIAIPLWSIAQQQEARTPITVTELGQGVHRLFVNNAVSVVSFTGEDGLLIIDTGYERTVYDLSAKLKELSDKPLRYIINTHIHGDHTGGNVALGDGVDIIAHQNVKDYLSKEKKQGDRVIAALPEFAQPNISFTEKMNLSFNSENLQLIHLPEGHTSGDIIIFFPKKNVLVVGDLLFANYFPYVDVGNGGNPIKFLANVEWINQNFPADVTIVGGHGPIYTIDEYKNYHKTLLATIDALKKHKQKGMTAEQMKEAKVLNEWASFGSFFITEDRWIDTLFPFL